MRPYRTRWIDLTMVWLLSAAATVLVTSIMQPAPAVGQSAPPTGSKVNQTPANLTYTNTANGTCGAASAELKAAAASTDGPIETTILVPSTATTGIRIAFGAVADGNSPLIEPGQAIVLSTKQQIQCIRAGGSNVTVGLLVAKGTP